MTKRTIGCTTLVIMLLLAMTPVAWVEADMGPKPSMDFEFDYQTQEPLTIVKGVQYQCDAEDCADAEMLEEAGPQLFYCRESFCASTAYGYSEFSRLSIRFSDGETRESNVFSKEHFAAEYRVTVRESDLWVEEVGGGFNFWNLLLIGGAIGICIAGLVILALGVVWLLLIVRGGRGQLSWGDSKGLFIVAWLVALLPLLVGSLASLAFLLTVLIEGALALVYATVRKRSRLTWLTLALLVNLVTLPGFYLLASRFELGIPAGGIAAAEILVWLVEAVLYYLPQRKTASFREALLVSLLLNLASLLVGLLLPV